MLTGYRTETRSGPEGPVIVRSAVGEEAGVLLKQEATRLEQARHPGVVELLSAADEELTIAWAGAQTLELTGGPLPVVGGLLASIASTVADLHEIGIIHGRLDATHVVIDNDGRPRLCGMRGPSPHERPPTPTDDVAALGALIDLMVGTETDLEPIPERRWSRKRWSGYQRRALLLLADQAAHEDPARRPTARALAAGIAEAVPVQDPPPPIAPPSTPDPPPDLKPPRDPEPQSTPAATSPPPPAIPSAVEAAVPQPAVPPTPRPVGAKPPEEKPEPPAHQQPAEPAHHPDPPPPARSGRLAVTAVALVLVAAIVWRVQPLTGTSVDPAASPTVANDDPPPATSPTVPVADGCPDAPEQSDIDLDGDGCSEPVTVRGTRVEAMGITYEIGEPGDRVAVADWDCDGIATAALVRPTTGEVFVFSGWTADDQPVTVAPVTTVAGATVLVPPDHSCGTGARVRLIDGTTEPLLLEDGTG